MDRLTDAYINVDYSSCLEGPFPNSPDVCIGFFAVLSGSYLVIIP